MATIYQKDGLSVYEDPTKGTVNAQTGEVISSASLAPQSQIQLPQQPQSLDYSGISASSQAMIDANSAIVKANQDAITKGNEASKPDTIDQYKTDLSGVHTPDLAGLFKSTYDTPEQATLRANANEAQAKQNEAQGEFDALNARLAGLNYQRETVIPTQQQEAIKGRGVTAGGLAPLTASQQRQNLLEAAPLQYQALISQAKVASAQRNTALAQGILQSATQHLDKVFSIMSQDAQNKYEFKLKTIDAVYQAADKKEQKILDQQKTDLATNNTTYTNYINDIQTAIKSATDSGDTALAGQISQLINQPLDPTSKTFKEDYQKAISKLATYQARITDKTKVRPTISLSGLTPEQQKDPFIQKMINSSGGKPITDTFAQSLNKGLTVLSQLGVLETNIKNTSTGPLVGLFRGANPWDTNAQTIKAQLNAIVPNLARGIYGEVGVLTDNDIKTYSATLPNLKSTEDIRNAVLGITVDLIGKSIKRTLEINAANGKDVSGFIDLYTEMQNTRDSIFSQIPGYKGATKSLQEIGVSKDEENLFDSTIGTSNSQDTSLGGFFSNIWKGLTGQ